MLQALRARLDRDEEGFTLIELMVVVLIIAILLAIAIPTFLGARQKANDRAAQSSLRNALTAAKTVYADKQSFASADDQATGLVTIEPSVDYVAKAVASVGFKSVSVDASDTTWAGAAMSKSGKCFWIKEVAGQRTQFGTTAAAADCTGTKAIGANTNEW